MSGTTFGYNFTTKSTVYETLNVEDSGNFCIESNDDSNIKHWLSVRTVNSNTFIVKINSTNTGIKIDCLLIEYDLNKIEKLTRKFLESGVTQHKVISYEEFKEAYYSAIQVYIN